MKTKYQIIIDSIRKKIVESEYKGGHKLPGQHELAEEYKVSAITANRALNELRTLGLIERRERSGSYVLSSPRLLNSIYILLSGEYANEEDNLMPYWQIITKLANKQDIKIHLISMKDSASIINELHDNKGSVGFIFLSFKDMKLIKKLDGHNIPYVVLGVKSEKVKYNVREDRYGAAKALTLKMVKKGCKNILFFGRRSFANHHEAEEGVFAAIEEGCLRIKVKAYNASERNIGRKIASIVKNNSSYDGIIVMGGMMPFLALPTIINISRSLKIGFMTENKTILQLNQHALIASYNQSEAAKLAFEMLLDITSGKISKKTTRLTKYKVIENV